MRPPGRAMSEPVSLLMIQFLDWVASRPRTYAQAMEAWRTSCPRLSVWEDAQVGDLIHVGRDATWGGAEVTLTPRGQGVLAASRRTAQPASAPEGE